MNDTRKIRFTTSAAPYQAGEVATFPADAAARFIRRGVAEFADLPERAARQARRGPKRSDEDKAAKGAETKTKS